MSAVTTRDVTDAEVSFFQKNGWVKLEQLFDREMLHEVLDVLQERMGESAESEGSTKRGRVPGLSTNAMSAAWQSWDDPSSENDRICEVTHSADLGRAAYRLLGDKPVRWYSDGVLAKLPAGKKGGATPWHQDLPYHAFDRGAMVIFWIPLVECPPNKGTMRFLSGSHKAGLLGRFVHREDGVDIVDYYPHLPDEYPPSEPLHLNLGDATAHHIGVIHYAPENSTDTTRWVFTTAMLQADVLYTGAVSKRTADLGLTVNEPLNHPNFPIVYPVGA